MRHLTVTGNATAAFIAATQSPTSVGSRHQAGAEAALLHAVGRAADIEVDLVIAEIVADLRRLGELRAARSRRAAARQDAPAVEAEQPLAVAMETASAVTISV